MQPASAPSATVSKDSPSDGPISGAIGQHRRTMLLWDYKYLLNLVALRVFRERRRLAFVAALAFAAGYIMYLRFAGSVLGLPVPVFTGFVYATFVGCAALMTSVLVPRLRFTVELVAVSRLLFSLLVFYAPELTEPMRASPLVSATIVVGGAAWVQILLSRDWNILGPARDLLAWLDDAIGRNQDQARLAHIRRVAA